MVNMEYNKLYGNPATTLMNKRYPTFRIFSTSNNSLIPNVSFPVTCSLFSVFIFSNYLLIALVSFGINMNIIATDTRLPQAATKAAISSLNTCVTMPPTKDPTIMPKRDIQE